VVGSSSSHWSRVYCRSQSNRHSSGSSNRPVSRIVSATFRYPASYRASGFLAGRPLNGRSGTTRRRAAANGSATSVGGSYTCPKTARRPRGRSTSAAFSAPTS
jgi:hypothetical protein